MVVDEVEDHPGRRKNSGFLQPMKHLSGKFEICKYYQKKFYKIYRFVSDKN